jgi:hypothetical protein
MGGLVRLIGIAWLLAGLVGVTAVFLGQYGVHLPLPPGLGRILSYPWSGFAETLGMAQALSATVTGVGVVINAAILFVIANLLER